MSKFPNVSFGVYLTCAGPKQNSLHVRYEHLLSLDPSAVGAERDSCACYAWSRCECPTTVCPLSFVQSHAARVHERHVTLCQNVSNVRSVPKCVPQHLIPSMLMMRRAASAMLSLSWGFDEGRRTAATSGSAVNVSLYWYVHFSVLVCSFRGQCS